MQSLWKTLRNPSEPICKSSFRVLGKFGGGNRKMLVEPQKVEFVEKDPFSGPTITIEFPGYQDKVPLPVERVSVGNEVKTAGQSVSSLF
jgi:transformation/transcription domain-associated protein